MTFKVRNVLCEHSLQQPNAFNRRLYPTKGAVPTIHVFGITPQGTKACVHIHGVLPYLLVRVGGSYSSRIEHLMREKIDKLLKKEGDTRTAFVYRMEPVMRKNFYGYHPNPEQFVKIFFTNPYYVTRLFQALGNELDDKPTMQPFEAHLSFIMQFFIDYSIFGMDEILFRKVQYRISDERLPQDIIHDDLTAEKILSDTSLLSPLQPMTSCYVECDAMAEDIINAEMLKQNVYSANPGLDYIWREEAVRCTIQGRPLEDTFNQYAPRPAYQMPCEKALLSRMKEISRTIRRQSDKEIKRLNLTQNLNETLTPESRIIEEREMEEVWSGEATQASEENEEETREKEEKEGEEEEEENDEQVVNMMTQRIDIVPNEEEDEDSDEERVREEPSTLPSKTPTSFRKWITLDTDLPLQIRKKSIERIEKKVEAKTQPTNITAAFENASFNHRMIMARSPIDRTMLLPSVSPDEVQAEGEVSEINNLTVCSLELLVQTVNSMPDPTTDSIIGASIYVAPDVCRELSHSSHVFVTCLPIEMCNNHDKVYWVEDELSIMNFIADQVKKCDAEILVGYDTVRLSWGYLIKRAQFIQSFTIMQSLNRYHNASEWKKDDVEAPNGRLLVAIWKVIRRDLTLRCYDRGTACLHVLKKKIPVLNDSHLSQSITNKNACHSVISYMLRLSYLNVALLMEMNWFLKNAEMARVYGIQFHEVWTRGSQVRVESMLLRYAHSQDYVAPSITPSQRNKMCAPEQLQLIMEPESKVYFEPVIVLDFQSLYPSMVIAYNYCYTTLLGKVAYLSRMVDREEKKMELGAMVYHPPCSNIVECTADREIHCSPLSAAFVKKSHRDGIVPTMLREVLGARIMIKTAAKFTKSKRMLRVFDARQLALKLVANVTYGYTAANWSGRMPCVEIADAILGKGRETLERAIDCVNKGDYSGARVIYGDTDSMFVLVPGVTLDKAFEIGRRIAADVTNSNPTPVVLKLEKVYIGCVLETKKRYAGWMFESEKETGRLESKGIETIRRDTCPLVSKVLERSLELIFTRCWDQLNVYIDMKLSRIHSLPYSDFIFCKEYRGDDGYVEGAPVPQKKVALSIRDKCSSHVILRGERIPYLMVEGPSDATVYSSVRSLQQFIANPSLKIHTTYYISAHLLPALRRVTDLLPLTIKWNPSKGRQCYTPDCRTIGLRPWCISCISSSDSLISSTFSSSRDERVMNAARVSCRSCQQRKDINMDACSNHSCIIKQVWNGVCRSEASIALNAHELSK